MKLLLVDPDAAWAPPLAATLHRDGHAASLAPEGRAALGLTAQDRYDAMIVERDMPHLDGIGVIRILRAERRTLPVVLTSVPIETDARIEGLDAGADDYLPRPFGAPELLARLHAILRGRQWGGGGDDTLRAGDIVVSPARRRAWRADIALDLPNLEFALLAELARHADTVLPRAALYARVWGQASAPETNIVDVYIRRLRRKLTAAGGPDPIGTVRGVGYLLRG